MKEKMRKDSLGSDTSSNADKKLQNQFSFVERATQTMNNSLKVQKNMTFLLRLAESFYDVKYWTSIIKSNVRQIILSNENVKSKHWCFRFQK